MCCTRKKATSVALEESKRNFDAELQISSFQELTESLQVKPLGIQELIEKKNALIAMPEWNTPNKNNLKKLKTQCDALMRTMMGQVKDMSRGLKALILINTQLEEEASVKTSGK